MGIYAKRLFPLICDRAMRAPELQARRAQLVDGTSGDVLEIGFGTGLSARFYDLGRVRRLIALEPSNGMTAKSRARIAAARVPIEMLELAGEDLPLPDASVDHVVCSLTLCSVADPARVLSEIRRVLRPGGALHFLEHVRSERPKIARWQDRLNGVQRRFADGCNLNRPTGALIADAGFAVPPLRQEREPALPFSAMFPVIQGIARKPA